MTYVYFKSWICILLCVYTIPDLQAQQTAITPSQEKLQTAQGTERVDLLNSLADQLKFSQPEQAKQYAEESFRLSQQLPYPKGLSTSAFFLGIYYRDTRNYTRAIRIVNTGLRLARETKDYPSALTGLDILKTIYRLTRRPKKEAEINRMYRQITAKMDLQESAEQLAELEKVIEQ